MTSKLEIDFRDLVYEIKNEIAKAVDYRDKYATWEIGSTTDPNTEPEGLKYGDPGYQYCSGYWNWEPLSVVAEGDGFRYFWRRRRDSGL